MVSFQTATRLPRRVFMSEEEFEKLKGIDLEYILLIEKALKDVTDINGIFEKSFDSDDRSNAELGQIARGFIAGRKLINLGFRRIKEIREGKP